VSTRTHDQVTEHIFLGGRLDRRSWRRLWGLGVTVVLSLQEEERDDFGDTAPEAELWLPSPDMDIPSLDQMWLACAFMHSSVSLGKKLVIHCRWGVGRSPMALAAYLVTQGWDPVATVDRLTKIRPIIRPNHWQIEQYEAFVTRFREGRFPPLPGKQEV
jgi:protein-tyrosine phosphatase